MKFLLVGFPVLLAFTISIAFAQPAPPGGPPVTITEIMYNPPEVGNDSLEFIEIRNPDPENQRNIGLYTFTAGVEYTFPINTILEPHEYVIVAIDSVVFENTFGIPAFQWTSGALSNNGEALVLQNTMNTTVDSVMFDNVAPWPTEADGSGASLVLCNDTLDNSSVDNWSASETNTGIVVNGSVILANPGADCTVTGNAIDNVDRPTFKIYPNPARDWVKIKLENALTKDDFLLQLFDHSGVLVQETEVSLASDAKIKLPESLSSGIYTVSLIGEKTSSRQPLLILE